MKTPRSFNLLSVGALVLLLCAPAAHAQCASDCTMDFDPVCGDNGVFYSNDCFRGIDECLTGTTITPTGNLDCDVPLGGTAGFDEPDSAGVDPTDTWEWPAEDPSSEPSSSSSDDGDGDSDDDSDTPVSLPPGVVIDDSAPSASDFAPTSKPSPASGGNDTVVIILIDSPGLTDDKTDLDGTSSTSSSEDGSGGSDDDDDDNDDDDDTQCEILCFTRYDPICATNGVTYHNRCELSVAQCIDPTVELSHPGDCNESPPIQEPADEPMTPFPVAEGDDMCAYLCPMWDHPVCSEDGHIYANDCVFQSALCRDATLQPATDALCVPL